jgi:large conductance mechanosensitive channel
MTIMLEDYRDFILRTNTLALAIGVIIGAATSKLVTSIVDDLLMPMFSFFMPAHNWTSAQIILSKSTDVTGATTVNAIKYGHFIGSIIDFLVISFVVFILTRFLGVKQAFVAKTKQCPECLEDIPRSAKKCRACCSALEAA